MKNLIVLIGFLFTLTTGNACDCDYNGDFLVVAPQTKMVALVTVKKFLTFKNIEEDKTPMSMEVEIIEVYKGVETRKTITIWGDDGALCRPYLSTFVIGKSYVMALYNAGERAAEKKTDYSITNCGEFWLTIKREGGKTFAVGKVGQKLKQIDIVELKQKLKK